MLRVPLRLCSFGSIVGASSLDPQGSSEAGHLEGETRNGRAEIASVG
jgi:hypothetical protein